MVTGHRLRTPLALTGAMLAVLGGCTKVSTTTVPAQTTSPDSTAPTFDPIELRQLGICAADCEVTGAIGFDHPAWRRTWLLTVKSGGAENDPSKEYETHLLAVDADRNVHWKWDGGSWSQFAPVNPSTDKTGHLFIRYNPGRYDGLLVLAPTGSGFDDFGSLPSQEQLPTSRFYSVSLRDDDHDGVYDIRAELNTCDPTCADAHYVFMLYRWDGHDYTER